MGKKKSNPPPTFTKPPPPRRRITSTTESALLDVEVFPMEMSERDFNKRMEKNLGKKGPPPKKMSDEEFMEAGRKNSAAIRGEDPFLAGMRNRDQVMAVIKEHVDKRPAPIPFDFDESARLMNERGLTRVEANRVMKKEQIVQELNSENPDFAACLLTLMELLP